jgi:hypothetical protein
LKGACGGALAGYLGGGPFELDNLGNQMLISGALGAAIGMVVVAWLAFESGAWDRVFWLFVPGVAAATALLVGFREAFDWALGWAVAQQAKGLVAAGLGAAAGAALAAGLAYIAAWRRDRAYNRELQNIRESLESSREGTP